MSAMFEKSAALGIRKPVVGHQADQQRTDQAAHRRSQPADHDDDEDQHVDLRAQLRHHRLLVQPHSAPPSPASIEPATNTPTNRWRMR